MESIKNYEEIEGLKSNKIIGIFRSKNTQISFIGSNNILYCEDNIELSDCSICFNANNSIIFLKHSNNAYRIHTSIYNNSILYFGSNNYFNGRVNLVISEETNIIIGDNCLFSFDCWLRTADPHIIYNFDGKRINPSKSIYLGDHIWLGQHVFILKGTCIGSGSIIGAMSVVSGKRIPSNCIYAGNPAKLVKEDIFFTSDCVHNYKMSDTIKHNDNLSQEYIYHFDNDILSFSIIENELNKIKDSSDRLNYIKSKIPDNNKNRFYIEKKEKIKKHFFKR